MPATWIYVTEEMEIIIEEGVSTAEISFRRFAGGLEHVNVLAYPASGVIDD